MSTRDEAIRLLQTTYYDHIDKGEMAVAVSALHPDVDWSHAQVWAHHGFARGEPTAYRTRDEVEAFLSARVDELRESGIQHKMVDLIIEGDRGALLGHVLGPDGSTKPFMVWFEMSDGLISRYTLRPI